MSLAALKQTIERNEDRKDELAPAEREDLVNRPKAAARSGVDGAI